MLLGSNFSGILSSTKDPELFLWSTQNVQGLKQEWAVEMAGSSLMFFPVVGWPWVFFLECKHSASVLQSYWEVSLQLLHPKTPNNKMQVVWVREFFWITTNVTKPKQIPRSLVLQLPLYFTVCVMWPLDLRISSLHLPSCPTFISLAAMDPFAGLWDLESSDEQDTCSC